MESRAFGFGAVVGRIFLYFLLFISLTGYTQPEDMESPNPTLRDSLRFNPGESLEFKLSYGWFTVGKGELQVDTVFHKFDGKDCYKAEINGKTAGLVGVFAKVNDTWGAYVSTEDLLPVMGYNDIQEGDYTRNEKIYYDQETGRIEVERYRNNEQRPTKHFDHGPNIHDLISGYMHLRNVNFSNMNKGDTIGFKAFYDHIFYDFKIVYQGIESIKSRVGELRAHKIIPLIPENRVFPGTHPITAWVSADANQLPLRIKANMFFGTAYCELTGYKNIKYGPDFE